MPVIFKIMYFLYFLWILVLKKREGWPCIWATVVLNSNPTTLQHSLDPPQQRQHQVLQVLAVALLQGGD